MPELVPGFVKVTEAGREYKTSRSTLDRRREAARDSGSPKLYRVFRLRAKDGEVFEQPSKEQVAQLTKEGRVPEWYVSRSWLAKEFGKRADEGRAGATAQGADHEPQRTSGLLSVVRQQYEERIKDLKEQLDAARQEKKELLQYAQADKQMFAQAAQQLTQVLALPAIAEANKNRTSATVQANAPQSDQTDSRAAGDRNGTLPPAPLASKSSGRPGHARELCLRFPCPSCQRLINVPLHMTGTTAQCPGCSQPLAIPDVDESVVGFDRMRDCVGRSTSPPRKPEPARAGKSDSRHGNDRAASDDVLNRSPFANASPEHYEPVPADEVAEPAQPNSASASITTGSGVNPRILRLICALTIWLGPILFLFFILVLGGAPAAGFILTGLFLALPWFFIGAYIAGWITPLILAATVHSIRCPGCHEQIQAVNRWFCSCGYHDHRERNLFLFRCPSCRKRIGHTNCPQCDSTILL